MLWCVGLGPSKEGKLGGRRAEVTEACPPSSGGHPPLTAGISFDDFIMTASTIVFIRDLE